MPRQADKLTKRQQRELIDSRALELSCASRSDQDEMYALAHILIDAFQKTRSSSGKSSFSQPSEALPTKCPAERPAFPSIDFAEFPLYKEAKETAA